MWARNRHHRLSQMTEANPKRKRSAKLFEADFPRRDGGKEPFAAKANNSSLFVIAEIGVDR